MAELSFASLVESKPVKVDLDGVPVCVTRIGDEVSWCRVRFAKW